MIVYHGSTQTIEIPDVEHSKRYLDFGKAFYVTSYRIQAERWAKRKCEAERSNRIQNNPSDSMLS